MDGLKLAKWIKAFNAEVRNLQIEFDSFFNRKRLESYYELKLDELSEDLHLIIKDNNLPNEIKDRLTKAFMDSKPEDSV